MRIIYRFSFSIVILMVSLITSCSSAHHSSTIYSAQIADVNPSVYPPTQWTQLTANQVKFSVSVTANDIVPSGSSFKVTVFWLRDNSIAAQQNLTWEGAQYSGQLVNILSNTIDSDPLVEKFLAASGYLYITKYNAYQTAMNKALEDLKAGKTYAPPDPYFYTLEERLALAREWVKVVVN